MTTSLPYRVGITLRDGSVDGWVFDLPGCRAIGGSREEVMALLPVVIADHAAWLTVHGESVQPGTAFEVMEEVSAPPRITEFCFEADRSPLQDEDLARALRHLLFAQEDLTALAGPLPDAVLDWKPPASAVKIDAIYPDVRSIREMLQHVAAALSFHLRGVGTVAERVPEPLRQDLAASFETAVARLQALDAEERAGTLYRRSGPRGDSEWTAAKAIRRIVNHVRFHTREVQQRLCWLTLGVPEVLPASRE